MIDIFPKIFSDVLDAVTAVNPKVNVTDVTAETMASYPAVIVREISNVPLRQTATAESCENHSRITVDLDVRSNKKQQPKAEAKALFQAAEAALYNLFFTRISGRPIPAEDRTIYRMYGQYEVICEAPIEDGKNTVYKLYRRFRRSSL